MEYVDGDTLSNLRLEQEDRSFRVEELVPIIRQLCEALSLEHEIEEVGRIGIVPGACGTGR